MENWKKEAETLVNFYVAPQGINNMRILDAMRRIPRHLFVPTQFRVSCYSDSPLPIGEEQTISQPYIVARMTDLLDLAAGDKVLEIGTGSGYQSALLAEMKMKVTTVERIEKLATKAREIFKILSYDIHSIIDDGRKGYPPDAPYQGIIVTARTTKVEESWLEQLAEDGKLIVPLEIQPTVECLLVRQKKSSETGRYADKWYDYCHFVPLLPGIKNKS